MRQKGKRDHEPCRLSVRALCVPSFVLNNRALLEAMMIRPVLCGANGTLSSSAGQQEAREDQMRPSTATSWTSSRERGVLLCCRWPRSTTLHHNLARVLLFQLPTTNNSMKSVSIIFVALRHWMSFRDKVCSSVGVKLGSLFGFFVAITLPTQTHKQERDPDVKVHNEVRSRVSTVCSHDENKYATTWLM